MIISYSNCRRRIHIDSSVLGVDERAVRCDKFAYTRLQELAARKSEIVREGGTDRALATDVVSSSNVESARDVLNTLRLQLLDKDQQELRAQTLNSPVRRLSPEQSLPH